MNLIPINFIRPIGDIISIIQLNDNNSAILAGRVRGFVSPLKNFINHSIIPPIILIGIVTIPNNILISGCVLSARLPNLPFSLLRASLRALFVGSFFKASFKSSDVFLALSRSTDSFGVFNISSASVNILLTS